MNIFEPILLGIVLSADSFSAAIAMGFRKHTFKDTLKFAIASGGTEAIATLIGAITGEKIISQFSSIDHWIAFSLLFCVALHMLYEGIIDLKNRNHLSEHIKFHGFFKVFIVSLATSIDALAIGVSLGISNKILTPYIFFIGMFAFLSTIIGMTIAKKVPKRFSSSFNIIGALIILFIAFDMLSI
ncbi:manganese efflux pump [Thiotrichales bacterium 19S3-7]|nr:manganese efflux pump [Thiotrichales bacterium 19S3-7]MCF6803093.1 manganese efflux pump [Thiotrichales bacterium 19S3-11]